MLSVRSPIFTGSDTIKLKSNRKPLQPRNSQANLIDDDFVKRNGKQEWIEISLTGNSNKENQPPITTTPTNNQIHQISAAWTNNQNHQIVAVTPTNKQNHQIAAATPVMIESFDSSLAEELGVIRRKFERLKLEKEKTERMLKERDLMFEMEMKRMEDRWKVQREIEIEVERVQRLNDLRSFCIRASRIQSLREIEEAKKNKDESQEVKSDVEEIETDKLSEASAVINHAVEQNQQIPVCV